MTTKESQGNPAHHCIKCGEEMVGKRDVCLACDEDMPTRFTRDGQPIPQQRDPHD